MGGGKIEPVSKKKLKEAIFFFEERVKDMGRINLNFTTFTAQTMKALIEVSDKSFDTQTVSIMWHDFLFIFFQFFTG